MRINDWSSDVCSSDLYTRYGTVFLAAIQAYGISVGLEGMSGSHGGAVIDPGMMFRLTTVITLTGGTLFLMWLGEQITQRGVGQGTRSEEHTSELQSLMRISYAVFCLKKKTHTHITPKH